MIIDGLKRIIGSAKVQLLTATAFGAVTTYLMTPGSTEAKRGLLESMVYALAALVGAVILGWAHEDAAKNKAAGQPQTQIIQDSNVSTVNTPQPVAEAPEPEPVPVPVPPKPKLVESKPAGPSQAQILTSAINAMVVEMRSLKEELKARPAPIPPLDLTGTQPESK